MASMVSRERDTASPGGARDGDITVQLIRSKSFDGTENENRIEFSLVNTDEVRGTLRQRPQVVNHRQGRAILCIRCCGKHIVDRKRKKTRVHWMQLTCNKACNFVSRSIPLRTSGSTYGSCIACMSSNESSTFWTASKPASSSAQSFNVSEAMPTTTANESVRHKMTALMSACYHQCHDNK